jgi:hypothetical protein
MLLVGIYILCSLSIPVLTHARAAHAPLLHRVCVRITSASSSASAVPCVDIALNLNASDFHHETRTSLDWILRLPPLNVCIDFAFAASGFLLLPLLYRSIRRHGLGARKIAPETL